MPSQAGGFEFDIMSESTRISIAMLQTSTSHKREYQIKEERRRNALRAKLIYIVSGRWCSGALTGDLSSSRALINSTCPAHNPLGL